MWTEFAVNISTVAIAIYVLLALIEVSLDLYRGEGHYQLKDSLCSMTMGGFYIGTKLLMKSITLVVLLFATQYSVFDFGIHWWLFPVAYIVADFCFYWLHRFIHEVRIGWAAHVNHHSSQEYNLAGTALRQSFAEPVMEPFFYAPMVLIGFDPFMTLAAIELNLIYMYWLHTRKIGKLHHVFEFWFSTPSHHRVHHGANVQYLDKNYGGTFIVFDRLFGSFEEEKETVEFGIPEQINSFNPIVVSFHGWVALGKDVVNTPGILNKIGLFLMPPGWAPDGGGLTTKEKQSAYYAKKNQAVSV
ncbi:MAG: sterol desaturase/sphingolipid hydroxylase (fatty acid hydroxylase superfamily) [Paraglaciecola psychrophila]|jgi:sterol desaturase/sphingolipid hydroxylase (fatty acid hydroxylase superfamily)